MYYDIIINILSDVDNNKFNDCFHLTYKMYETFEKVDTDIFQNINTSLITDEKVKLYKNLKYCLFDIRYENKLNCNIDIDKYKDNKCKIQDDKYILYTPQYFLDMIRSVQPIFIIIITEV